MPNNKNMSVSNPVHLRKYIAGIFLLIHSFSIAGPVLVNASAETMPGYAMIKSYQGTHGPDPASSSVRNSSSFLTKATDTLGSGISGDVSVINEKRARLPNEKVYGIGGPSQPEMASFKPVGTDNLVNLFTGDFSYNIPLLDVGGYPVNIFYNSGITMDQDASWVGLGWNINPGSITRNMRGVPDDFDGTEKLKQTQTMKPNVTWGGNLGFDFEYVGLKNLAGISIGATTGISFNNYLGPALSQGLKGGLVFNVANNANSEKTVTDSLKLRIGVDANLGSRSGFALSPNVSLTASQHTKDNTLTAGISASTSYNSRSGIKAMQISEQVSASEKAVSGYHTKVGETGRKGGYESSASGTLYSSTISFTKPSYIPAMRMPITNSAYSGHFQIGGAIWGGYASGEVEVYKQQAEVAGEDVKQTKPMVGYLHYQKAIDNPHAVMDFNRLNDKEVTASTPIISAPQYSYDVFSIQGEGTGGSIRFYRNDMGYVRDNYTRSKDKNISAGVDVGIIGQVGVNFNLIKTPSTIGEWGLGNGLRSISGFGAANEGLKENVYLRNPGETSVLQPGQYSRVGNLDLIRFKLGGLNNTPTILPQLEKFRKDGYSFATSTNGDGDGDGVTGEIEDIASVDLTQTAQPEGRAKRTQVTSFLTAKEASEIGLDKKIKSYSTDAIQPDGVLVAEPSDRVDIEKGKWPHHISQINVTEADGKRYVYGVPVYNTYQEDFTFSVGEEGTMVEPDRVIYSTDPDNANGDESDYESSNHLKQKSNTKRDGYYQKTETPAYAHSYLLSGLLSPDYVDVDDNGITENDLGTAVKFNYTRMGANYHWRTPYDQFEANFNAGNFSEKKDDKALFTHGERESWYMHSIESKTMIAIFTLADRNDGKGVNGIHGGINVQDKSLKRLTKIDLYSKADVKAHGTGVNGAKPIKTVNFEYSYKLCGDVPGNDERMVDKEGNEIQDASRNVNAAKGKLTLEKIYFTYNGKSRAKKEQYVFNYGGVSSDNPSYKNSSSDRWGTFKLASQNPSQTLPNKDYPFSLQAASKSDAVQLATINANAAAWSLKKILLPSGGQLEVDYESDDYAYVQNKRAMDMLPIAGFGHSGSDIPPTDFTSANLYENYGGSDVRDNEYVLINVPTACVDYKEVYKRYLEGTSQLSFKLAVHMPKNDIVEYVTCYADLEEGLVSNPGADNHNTPKGYGVLASDHTKIWLRLKPVDGYGPLSLTVLEYLREQLPGQAYPGSDVSEEEGLEKVGKMLGGMMDAFKCAFTKPVNCFRENGLAKKVLMTQSFIRLNDPDGVKYGGGLRVKEVRMRDNWKEMTKSVANGQQGQYTSVYGNQYDYSTTEMFDGATRNISSGVASYEPSIGNEENPFLSIVKVANTLPLGPTSYGSVEMPVLDAFFPAPLVGYSKVTVRSLNQNSDNMKKLRSGTGRQVHEFYTAKDYPVYYSHTSIDPSVDKQEHRSSTVAFFSKYAFDSRALSQGFLIATNDMHGKTKSQASYAETDPNTPVTYTEYFYRNTGSKGLDEKFDFAYTVKDGTDAAVVPGNMGIDVELMTDTREFSVKGRSLEIQAQFDLFPVVLPAWLPFIWPVVGESESVYRAVTTTKVISYHSVVDKVVAIDKGSKVSTENLVYDAETGNVLVTRTNNEFDQPVYNVTYPAWWAYGGMGLAYKNIDAVYTGVNFEKGVPSKAGMTADDFRNIFESGDELYILASGADAGCAPNMSKQEDAKLIWVFDRKKDLTSLVTIPDLIFLDKEGYPFNRTGVSFRIVRSGHRNMLGAPMASITLMADPLMNDPNPAHVGWRKFKDFTLASNKVVNASAVEYKEKWPTDNDVIGKYKEVVTDCIKSEVFDCAEGDIDKSINPYLKGLVGNFKGYKNWVFYGGRQQENFTTSTATNLPKDGFLKDFTRFWTFQTDPTNTSHKYWAPIQQPANPLLVKWVSNSEATRFNKRGMELETKDALNIYTSAQYGYHNSMPLAVTNNSPFENSFYDGFEDEGYQEQLNIDGNEGCGVRHINFLNTIDPQSGLKVPTGLEIIKNDLAHTGKHILKALGNHNVKISTKTINSVNNVFNLNHQFETPITYSLSNPGVNLNEFVKDDENSWSITTQYAQPNQRVSHGLDLWAASPNPPNGYKAILRFSQYFEVPANGYYPLYLEASVSNTVFTVLTNVEIKNLYTSETTSHFTPISPEAGTVPLPVVHGYQSTYNNSVYLCKGVYIINASFQVLDVLIPVNNPGNPHLTFSYSLGSTGVPSSGYKTIGDINGCTYLQPLATTESMLNPVFSIPSGKKMLFSGWVNQSVNSGGKVQFYNGSTLLADLSPSGPVIEGWQKIEGDVTVPQNATTVDLKLVNTGSQPIYFDDIRMHPYNANMKSYVYDPESLRLKAELDANNYASFYEYDEEGTLIRTKAETKEGIKTITETRSAKQKVIETPLP